VNAVCAHQSPFHPAVEIGFDSLQIGPPNPFRFVVGMAHVVPDGAALAADGTDSRHNQLLILSMISEVEKPLK
jgi:hypothetical protein